MSTKKINLGGGCFWCIETSFRRIRGVVSVVSGYSGGHVESPTYEQVVETFYKLQNDPFISQKNLIEKSVF